MLLPLLEESQRPGSGSREAKLSNPRGGAARAMHEFFFENLRKPAHSDRAGRYTLDRFQSSLQYSRIQQET
jgi:hypothetical protein